ncbi:MAG: translation initiation factor, partial [Bacteroidota bacterium]
ASTTTTRTKRSYEEALDHRRNWSSYCSWRFQRIELDCKRRRRRFSRSVGRLIAKVEYREDSSKHYSQRCGVRPSQSARKIAENEEIQIKLYSIIYKAIEEIKEAMEGMLSARIEEQITGTAEIREVFKITKVGTIAGCFMLEGKVNRNSRVRVIRDGIVVYTGHLGSLKRFKDDVKEVVKGYECGLNIDKFNDIKVGDLVEAFEEVEVKQTL